MRVLLVSSLSLVAALLPLAAVGQDHQHDAQSTPYAGYETREIKSLSDQDIEALRRGDGWGLALPAELNGRPGPAHVLELRDALGLSAAQVKAVTAIFEEMRSEAIAAGERYIAAEAALSDAFVGADPSEDVLLDLLAEAAQARAALRFIHLSRHLSTPKLLSAAQIERYTLLRGYSVDPCLVTPDGHDPTMWRRHNGCD
ncbi:MAG: hypothetical protein AAFR46_06570 [Pseudomonadota bacterium]